MRVIIAGGRDYAFTRADIAWLDGLHEAHRFTLVVSGCATGTDRQGELWAQGRGISVRHYRAEWNRHGRAAGPLRNALMAENADALALFPGGRGSASMKREALKRGLTVWESPTPSTAPISQQQPE